MRKKIILLGFLLALCGQVFAQTINVDISSITVAPQEPGFFKPGDNMTITIDKSGSTNWTSDTVFMMIVLSRDNTISPADDHLLEISGNSLTMKPFSSVASSASTKSMTTQQTYNYNFQVPAGLTGDYYIIVRVGQKKVPDWGQQNSSVTYGALANPTNPPLILASVKTKSIQVEFSTSKNVVYNTAFVGDKSSRAKLIITAGAPKANIIVSNYDIDNLPKVDNSDKILFDTRVFGTGESVLGIPKNGNIKLEVVDISGNSLSNLPIRWSFDKNLTCDNGNLYNNSPGIEISGTVTLYAIVCPSSNEYEAGEMFELSFVQDLKKAEITLITCDSKPANYPQAQPFGLEQEISISFDDSDGGKLWYKIDSKELNETEIKSSATPYSSSPVLATVKDFDNAGTIYINVFVEGGKDEPTLEIWKFVRESLPVPVVNPSGNPAKKFTVSERPLNITASLQNTNDLCGYKILYTTDGNDPRTSASAQIYNGAIPIYTTTTLKFASVAGNRLPSEVVEHTYRLVTGGNGAYFDTKGKGGVDSVEIITEIPVENLPDNVRLTSPWHPTDEKNINKNDNDYEISLKDNEFIVIKKKDKYIFPSEEPYAKTDFEPKILAQLFGDEYGDEGEGKDFGMVYITDKIAPVPTVAAYIPGQIDSIYYHQTGEIKVSSDNLIVTFSEPTYFIPDNGNDIFEFLSDGVRYGIRLIRVLEGNGTAMIKFETEISESVFPDNGDILYLRENTIRESKNGGVTQEKETSVRLGITGSADYLTIIKIVTPVVPGNTNPVIVVDFIKKSFTQTEREKLNIVVKIIDATGNLVADLDGINSKKDNISAEIADKTQALQIRVKWNGKNRASRNVGVGAYLAILEITGPDGAPNAVSKTIGVGTKR